MGAILKMKGVLKKIINGKQLSKNGWSIGLIMLEDPDKIHNITIFKKTVEEAKTEAERICGDVSIGQTCELQEETVTRGKRDFVNVVSVKVDKNVPLKDPSEMRDEKVTKFVKAYKETKEELFRMYDDCVEHIEKKFPEAKGKPEHTHSMVNTLFIALKSRIKN